MNMNRRRFLSIWLARPAQLQSVRVAVLETFKIGDSCAALLVHHAEAETRDVFAKWLQAHPNATIRIRRQDGQEVTATIFRVRMCFGRGLILLQSGLPVREREILTMTFERELR
jgi:hypothetical protein